jgi:ATP synthase protein I
MKLKGFSHIVKSKEDRKLKELQKSKHSVWFGLGMFGLIGWSVVVPTLLGTLLGIWLDGRFPGKHSWTLTFLLIGLIIGCVTAGHWLSKENKDIHNDKEDHHEGS